MEFFGLLENIDPLVGTLIAVGVLATGTGAGVVAFERWARRVEAEADRVESYLAPTLAIDALDSDLRVVYMKSLVLDAEGQDRLGDLWDRSVHGELGREIRRLVIAAQAARVAGDDRRAGDILADTEQILGDSLDDLEDDGDLATTWARRAARARNARTTMRSAG